MTFLFFIFGLIPITPIMVEEMKAFEIKPIGPMDHQAVCDLLVTHWGSPRIVTRGIMHQADHLPGFAAVIDDEIIGLVTFRIENKECEIISLNSLREKTGIGTALIKKVRNEATRAGCRRLWLVTTNDNTPAIEFYNRRGFRIAAIHNGAIEKSRKLKPEIPMTGIGGVPIIDEIEMEMRLE